MAGFRPERLQRFAPAVYQLELRRIHHNAPIGPRRRDAGDRVAKSDCLGTRQKLGDMFVRYL